MSALHAIANNEPVTPIPRSKAERPVRMEGSGGGVDAEARAPPRPPCRTVTAAVPATILREHRTLGAEQTTPAGTGIIPV